MEGSLLHRQGNIRGVPQSIPVRVRSSCGDHDRAVFRGWEEMPGPVRHLMMLPGVATNVRRVHRQLTL
jgi:hypothetical protein